MRYLVLSDIHGAAERLDEAFARFDAERCDVLLMLGDYLNQGPRNMLPTDYNTIRCIEKYNEFTASHSYIAIKGNCDSDVDDMVLEFPATAPYWVLPMKDGGRVIAEHGDKGCYLRYHPGKGDLVLSGHTHIYKAEKSMDYCVGNPGSVGSPKGGNPPTYGILDTDAKSFDIYTLDGERLAGINF